MTNARIRLFAAIFAATAVLLALTVSCREPAREQARSPQKPRQEYPPRQKQPGQNAVATPAPNPKGEEGRAHGPERDCELCHGKRDREQIASAQVKLVARLSELCIGCHPEANYSNSKEVVHGPLAVVECLFCHDQHLSKNSHLLKEIPPKLCYDCHEKEAVEAISDHTGTTECLSCHTGHSSPQKGLLKETQPI